MLVCPCPCRRRRRLLAMQACAKQQRGVCSLGHELCHSCCGKHASHKPQRAIGSAGVKGAGRCAGSGHQQFQLLHWPRLGEFGHCKGA